MRELFLFVGGSRKVGVRLRSGVRPWSGIRDRGAGRRSGNEQAIGVVRGARLLPREAAQGHAAEDDRQRPNIRGTGVIFLLVIYLGSEVWV